MDADGAGKCVTRLAFVEFGGGHTAKLWIGNPAQGEERARDTTHLAKPSRERVLARVGAQPSQDQRGRDGAGTQRGREAAHARGHRVIAFDRPGYGYSGRPRGTAWTAAAQAALFRRAFPGLDIESPVVVGHSWGTLAALALALADPAVARGLVLVSGYYYPTARTDALLVAPAAVPLLGDVLRHTISPLFGAATLPLLLKGMFAPLPVPERFEQGFECGLPVRPLQIRSQAEDGAGMAREAATMRDRYGELHMPVMIMAGSDDQVVDVGRHAIRLHQQIAHSELGLVPGAGHMVHHAVPEQVADMIEAVAEGRHRLPGGPELEGTRPAGAHDRLTVAAE